MSNAADDRTEVLEVVGTAVAERDLSGLEGLDSLPPSSPPPTDVSDRIRRLNAENSSYAQEFALRALHQMLIARIPLDEIARKFGVSVATIASWRNTLYDRLAQELTVFDAQQAVAEMIARNNQLHARGMQLIMDSRNSRELKIGADICARAEDSLRDLYNRTGVFDRVELGAGAQSRDPREDAASYVSDMLHSFLSGEADNEEDNGTSSEDSGPKLL